MKWFMLMLLVGCNAVDNYGRFHVVEEGLPDGAATDGARAGDGASTGDMVSLPDMVQTGDMILADCSKLTDGTTCGPGVCHLNGPATWYAVYVCYQGQCALSDKADCGTPDKCCPTKGCC
jgi:hypothetical protein